MCPSLGPCHIESLLILVSGRQKVVSANTRKGFAFVLSAVPGKPDYIFLFLLIIVHVFIFVCVCACIFINIWIHYSLKSRKNYLFLKSISSESCHMKIPDHSVVKKALDDQYSLPILVCNFPVSNIQKSLVFTIWRLCFQSWVLEDSHYIPPSFLITFSD